MVQNTGALYIISALGLLAFQRHELRGMCRQITEWLHSPTGTRDCVVNACTIATNLHALPDRRLAQEIEQVIGQYAPQALDQMAIS